MKPVKIFSLAALLIVAALASTAFINVKLLNKVNTNDKGFAVVELFTSEGCSSCPPADELVAKVEKESKDKPVYILAFHVDYWNRLGWKDQFSSADFSKRQQDYARYLHIQGVYTPQIVVNGEKEFVGSQEGTLRDAIRTGLQNAATARIELNVSTIDQKRAILKYAVEGTGKNTVLQVAVLEKAATSKVASGENGGRTLSHVQIVRRLQAVTLNENTGTASIALPKDFDTKNWEIIGFLQNKVSGVVTGAGRVLFSNQAMSTAAVKGTM